MRCFELHNNECERELQPGWKYCPDCGSLARLLDWAERNPTTSDGIASLRFITETDFTSDLVWIEGDHESVRFQESRLSVTASRGESRGLRCELLPGIELAEVKLVLLGCTRWPREPAFLPGKKKVARKDLTRTCRLRRKAKAPIQLHVVPEILVGSANPQKVRLHATGEGAVQGLQFSEPSGWRISYPTDLTLRGGTSIDLEVTAGSDAQDGVLSVGSQEACTQLRLVRGAVGRLRTPPRFVVGLDFGTSSTSLAYLDCLVLNGEPKSLGESARFSTTFFLRDRNMPSTWLYGERAEAVPETEYGLKITEIKRRLWEQDTTIQGPPGWGSIDACDVIEWYFSALRRDYVAPCLEPISRGPLDDVSVLWRIAIPVLEGLKKELFVSRLRNAWETSLRSDRDSLELIYEPDAALRGVREMAMRECSKMSEGDTVFLIDSGAGTTDIVSGTIRNAGGRLSIEVRGRAAVTVDAARKKGWIASDNFGGSDLSRFAASIAIVDWAKLSGQTEAGYDKLIGQLFGSHPLQHHWLKFGASELEFFPTRLPNEEYWHQSHKELDRRAEICKLGLLSGGSEKALQASFRPHTMMKEVHKNLAVKNLAPLFVESMMEELKKLDQQCDWLIFVGGNMNLEAFRQLTLGSKCRTPELDDTIRRLSVVKGLTLVPVDKGQIPPQVTVFISQGSTVREQIYQSNPRAVISEDRAVVPVEIPDDQDGVSLGASTMYGGVEYLIALAPLPTGIGLTSFEVKLSGCHITVNMLGSSLETEKLIDVKLPELG